MPHNQKPRPIRVDGDVAYITLTRGYEAVVDAADAAYVGQYFWQAAGRPPHIYAVRCIKGRLKLLLHRDLMAAPSGILVDHASGNTLDCRRANLRFATFAENSQNRRPRRALKGATAHEDGRWQAQIKARGRNHYLGLFDTELQAHEAYARASAELHGEFGRTA